MKPLWTRFEALISPVPDHQPLGWHRPRVLDRTVFDKLVQVLVLGASYGKAADSACSATTLRRRRDEWIAAGIFEELEQLHPEAYDWMVGIEFGDLAVDGCIAKAAGRSPVDRGKQGTKRFLLVDGNGIPLGTVVAAANRHGSPLLCPIPERRCRFGFLEDRVAVVKGL